MKRIARSMSRAITSYRAFAALATKPRFHSCTCRRSAKPPLVNARTRFRVAALVWYARSSRCGSGVRSGGVERVVVDGVAPVGGQRDAVRGSPSPLLRGLLNWPAIRPILTTGMLAP